MILFTSDWQASFSNLQRLDRVEEEIHQIRENYPFDHVVNLGDFKHAMNPIDVRVVNWAVGMIHRWTEVEGIRFSLLLGNHDMTGVHDDSSNWFPALEAAGARTFEDFDVIRGGAYELWMLPYRRDIARFRHDVECAAEKAGKKSILCFHQTLTGSLLRNGIKADGEDPRPEDLPLKPFRYAIGGHVHKPQQIGNVYYVGSPICHDWGEVNQQKRYLYLDRKGKLTSIPSKIPGWYDSDVEDFPTSKKLFKGATLRIHVPVSGKDSTTEITKARARAEAQYPDAKLHIVPALIADEAKADLDPEGVSELEQRELLKNYVADTAPPEFPVTKVVDYLDKKLAEATTEYRNLQGIKFRSAVGENVLSFASVECDFSEEGITVISGENKDWKESNGSGKTNFLQLSALALFGRTRKGQESDSWVCDDAKSKKAFVELAMILPDGQEMTVYRQRNPFKLEVSLEGEQIASGRGAQKDIEQLTGLTWDLMTSAIYLDQSEGNILVSGTDTARKALIFQILQLEKYSAARKLVAEDNAKAANQVSIALEKLNAAKSNLLAFEELIESAEEVSVGDPKAIQSALQRFRKKLTAAERARRKAEQEKAVLDAEASDTQAERDSAMTEQARAAESLRMEKQRLERIEELPATCPKCKQKVDPKHKAQHLKTARAAVTKAKNQEQTTREKYQGLEEALAEAYEAAEAKGDQLREQSREIASIEADIAAEEQKLERAEEQAARLADLEEKRAQAEKAASTWSAKLEKAELASNVYGYALKAFAKSGIPAYLVADLCPRLNAAALAYSEIFADGAIKVEFAVDERQDLDIHVENIHGGQGVQAQSRGEGSVVSLIVGFALRDVISPANILIADEPGDGLDERRAQMFADGLREISGRFGTVLITTHNTTILSALSDVRQIKIVKQGRISTVCEE